ncbi:MAG: hypothetical protein WCY27_00375 [archaeon]|jgi:hypothetical protein|nr:hypothetical protein [archaeon]MDD2477647.1 hypothetical protein [Candidatus ainarchaeum sp.]MDD3084373.1 hypothetical protein [Candidatus ainarchaeum sp.]MDD4220829.1 hypothetical protein [Candidatus ainarchaeum sp.]MDD4662329.1 hypothetical protein [Candidatus ainarchaeum sp.]
MINITTSIFPYRLDTRLKDSLELSLKVKNADTDIKLISIDVILDPNIALEKSGVKKAVSLRVGDLGGGKSILKKFEIYPFQGIKPGTYNVLVRVNEHYVNYEQLKSKTEKLIPIKAI